MLLYREDSPVKRRKARGETLIAHSQLKIRVFILWPWESKACSESGLRLTEALRLGTAGVLLLPLILEGIRKYRARADEVRAAASSQPAGRGAGNENPDLGLLP